ncbi:MAG: TraI domain-containing protein [Burkholderiales bacterium]|nr:TraI domain-containing protein [Burkholderiales bacterium]
MLELLLILAVLLLLVAVWLQLSSNPRWIRRLPQITFTRHAPSAESVVVELPAEPAPKINISGQAPGHLAVLTHQQLLQVTGADQLLPHLARHSRLAKTVFERDLLPAVQRYAEFVQLMPASESHHHANVGGLLAHTLETAHHALVLRGGYLLPRNGGAEIIDAQRDYWTYAVFFGALLHDVGKPLTDLRIEMRQARSSEGTRWLPMAGSLNECHAEQYSVKFAPKAERDYGAHGKLGVMLMQRLVPASALSFMGRCPEVLQELGQFLGGEARQGVIAEIVAKADQLSTKGNLASGSRARFATARSVPLVEQLMNAIQEMLRQGGQLPLNRDGAVGWVYDDSVWFVAKRLADTVREYVVARAGDEAGIPGENKNDRLFDCWQEYGQIMLNPQTGQAIWHVKVHGDAGPGGQSYSHGLSMLRFPLAKLWQHDTSSYPSAMAGRIEVLSKRKADEDAALPQAAPTNSPIAAVAPAESTSGGAARQPDATAAVAAVPDAANNPAANVIPAPRFAESAKKGGKRKASVQDDPDDFLSSDETARAGVRADKMLTAAAPKLSTAATAIDPKPPISSKSPSDSNAPEVSSESSWSPDAVASSIPTAPAAPIGRVALHNDAPATKVAKGAREPSETAVAFMQWVQQGLGEGSRKYNEAGATVHFVEAGIALVSPAIFREYAAQFGEPAPAPGAAVKSGADRAGLSIQRELLRAGWHVPSPADGANIWTFNVSRRGGVKTSKLSAVVLADARRWVMEPPPPNPALQLPTAEVGPSQ